MTKTFFPPHSDQCGYEQLTCFLCTKNFWRRIGQERDRIKRGCRGPYCSASCASKGRTTVLPSSCTFKLSTLQLYVLLVILSTQLYEGFLPQNL